VRARAQRDPTRSILSSTYSWFYYPPTDPALIGEPGLFAFQGDPRHSPCWRLRPSRRGYAGAYDRFSPVAYVPYDPRCASGRAR
jgi:hypothetical protein